MEYSFRDIEKKWQEWWKANKVYKAPNPRPDDDNRDGQVPKPKCYILDMFPYPSGAGLHVGHPLGYIASDIYCRYKRLKGFNVLHPMGYDAFGLPAEQYAIEHGIHPAVSTEANINNFRKQLDKIGFCYDWDRQVNTSEPSYYKWTQWIFLQLFKNFYNRNTNKAEPVADLVAAFEKEGNVKFSMPNAQYSILSFTAEEWKRFDEKTQQDILMQYRLSYCGYGEVNWCEALGTVLANDEVVNGVSERGGYPVVKKKLRQWYLRITEYANRLLEGLDTIEFSEAMKDMQSNWIGKSSGAEIVFGPTPRPTPGGEGGSGDPAISGKFFKTAEKKNWAILKDLSRENRKNKTEAEDILWQELRNNRLGHKVRRQHVIDGFIIDFAFLQKRLLIEVDGGYHEDEEQKKYDEARTEYLEASRYKVLRFTNEEVVDNRDRVIRKIKEELKRQSTAGSAAPLSNRRGDGGEAPKLRVYTTRPDTIFGVDFMVIAPEHELVEKITTDEQKTAVDEYIAYVTSRSERERMAEKKISGIFTGAYALNPFNKRKIPIWIAEYVLAGYGTGAIMAVPCGDERDHKFAKHFNIPITNIIGKHYNGEEANPTKDAILENSDFINGMVMKDAIEVVIKKIEEMSIGVRKVNYKMRDAAFSRQRYWGEPFPIKWINGVAYPIDESELPLKLPKVDSYKPGPEGEGPLANIPEWIHKKVRLAKQPESSEVSSLGGDLGEAGSLETNTMPGYAGSSWYFLRYMDPHNDKTFCNRKISDYWGQVDLYIGGTEHAVGHLLYSRMWTKALYDLGYIGFDEPYKKLVNQGMITGKSYFFNVKTEDNDDQNKVRLTITSYKKENPSNVFLRFRYGHQYVDSNAKLTRKAFERVNEKPSYQIDWSNEEGEDFIYLKEESEKMSKSKFNVDNPDDIIDNYGADTFRMYEMFLGPVEMSKPWDTKGIEGVHRFLKKFWRLFFDEDKNQPAGRKGLIVKDEPANNEEMKVLHKAIKKIEEDTDGFSFNTAVSAFMIATNELSDLKCHKKEILEPLLILLAPYAPHIAEELYTQLRQVSPLGATERSEGWERSSFDGAGASILNATYPKLEEKYLVESSKEYPISINGKLRTTMNISLEAPQPEVERLVLENEVVQKWLEGKPPGKIIYVKNKMINIVV